MLRYILFLFFIISALISMSQSLKIEIIDIKNTNGQMLIGVYTNKENYEAKQPTIWKAYTKEKTLNGKLIVTIDGLIPNTYGLALMDDEDSNWRMNTSFFIPTEGFAFSNYYHEGISQPTFDDFKFVLKSESKAIVMKMRYL